MTSPAGAPNQEIDCLSPEAQRLAEARLAAKRAARAEAREIRMKELERQQKEVEERPDKDFAEKGSRNMPSLSAATLASLGGTSSRRGSGDTSISMDTEASIREIKDSLAEVEEKYKKAMVSNAQLDNEKTNFMYQVDTLKDMLLELEEQLAESQRQYEEKNKELEREKHAHSILQFQFAEVKEALKQREEMLEALERQKEFFDSIRSERDELREETVKLKEELKKHGIILNSEITTNGETADTLNDVGYHGPSKMTKEELNALKSAGEGTLGKAKEVEMKKGIVENVGKGGSLQNSEQEQPRPNCVDKGVSHPGEDAEDQQPPEDSAQSPGLVGDKCEQQVQSQAQENTSFLKSPEQIESREVSDGRPRNSSEQSNCLGDLDSEVSGPPAALGIKSQSENTVGNQDKEKQENLETDLEKVSSEPCPHDVLGQTSEVDGVSCTDSKVTSGNHTEDTVQAGRAAAGEQAGAVAPRPVEHSKDTVRHDRRRVKEGVERSSERELSQEVAESEAGEENAGRDRKAIQAEVQATPEAPTVKSSHQDTAGPDSTDAKHEPRDAEEPDKEKSEQQPEALDSPQKKSRNKKKKNKKKKPPAPVDTHRDTSKQLNSQNTEAGDAEEEEQIQLPDRKQVAGTQSGETENPEESIVAGSSEHVNCPEDPENGVHGKQSREEEDDMRTQAGKGTVDGDTLASEAEAMRPLVTRAGGEEMEEDVTDGPADGPTDALPQNSPQCEEGDFSLMEKEDPPKNSNDASQRGSEGEHALSQHPCQTADKVVDGCCSTDSSEPAGERGDFSSGSGGQSRGEVENAKNKEDCTMS